MAEVTAPDIAAIARLLSKAQRKAIIRQQGFSRTVWAVYRIEPKLFGTASSSGGEGFLRRPTEIGVALRAHLLETTRV